MKIIRDKITDIVFRSIKEVSSFGSGNYEALSCETELIGNQGLFDSMAVISFITDVEDKIKSEFAMGVDLSKHILSNEIPTITVNSLVDLILTLIN